MGFYQTIALSLIGCSSSNSFSSAIFSATTLNMPTAMVSKSNILPFAYSALPSFFSFLSPLNSDFSLSRSPKLFYLPEPCRILIAGAIIVICLAFWFPNTVTTLSIALILSICSCVYTICFIVSSFWAYKKSGYLLPLFGFY